MIGDHSQPLALDPEASDDCWYCGEPLENTGPCGRGDRRWYRLEIGETTYSFCSRACREWWVSFMRGA